MKVTVTAAHIAAGVRGDPCWCPVALAMTDAGLTSVMVGGRQYRYRRDGVMFDWHDQPKEVHRFRCGFDTQRVVKPFEFEIEETQ